MNICDSCKQPKPRHALEKRIIEYAMKLLPEEIRPKET